MRGNCYITCEALYHLIGGKGSGWKPMNIRHENESHWFSSRNSLMDYLVQEWQKIMKKFRDEGRHDQHARQFDTFEGYISMISWRLYELPVDSDIEPRNIRSTTLEKMGEGR